MKKISFLIAVALIATLLLSCGEGEVVRGKRKEQTLWDEDYNEMLVDWLIFADAEELLEFVDSVFVGRVTGIDFCLLDARTYRPATEDTPESDVMLYHTLHVEIIESYKGSAGETVDVMLWGGMPYYRVDEQHAIIEPYGRKQIPIYVNPRTSPDMIGDAYLFAVKHVNDDVYRFTNPYQYYYPLDTLAYVDFFENLSVKEILREIGNGAWRDFKRDFDSGAFATDGQ